MYAKIFRQIFDSSIAENPELRFTFMDLLVLADSDGVVDMTHEAIARVTNRPIEVIRNMILLLESPDPHSRTPDENGARIKLLDEHRQWGWVIINFDRFRLTATELQRREKNRLRVQKYRENIRKLSNVTHVTRTVTPCNASVTPPYAYASPSPSVPVGGAGGRFQPPTIEAVKLNGAKIGLPDTECEKFLAYYESNGWRVGKNPMRSWPAAMVSWRGNWQERKNGQSNQINRGNSTKGFDRAKGTHNEGTGKSYTIEAVQKAREARDARRIQSGAVP